MGDDKYVLNFDKKGKVEEEKTPVGMEAQCWTCSQVWNISLLPPNATAVKCDCGGYVVSPSGKAMTRPIYDEWKHNSPLLELKDDTKDITVDK